MTIRFYLETYGCALNRADSDLIVGRLHQLGAKRVETPELADIIIVNTCGVKEPTEDKIIYRLQILSHEAVPVIVTGCLPKISFNRVKSAIPTFAAILGPQSVSALGDIVNRVLRGERGIVHFKRDDISKLTYFEAITNSVICTIPICEGCLGNCSYCAVRFARSTVRSYKIDELVEIVCLAVQSGFREIRLTAQDVGAFGHDTGETLVDLLYQLDQIEGSHRFRLGMFNPNLVLETISDILKIMRSSHFFKFFHVPLQSGSNEILRSMNRSYTVEEWKLIIEKIRCNFPNATIATDVIIGYPGETDEQFLETVNTIQEIRPQIVNISKYGDRPKTRAAAARNKVNTSVKKARSRLLSKIVHEISLDSHRKWVGWHGKVIILEKAPRGGYLARNESYLPIILFDQNLTIGIDISVKIVDATRTHLIGKI